MGPRGIVGVILVVAGLAILAIGHFSYSDTKPVLKAGPVELDAREQHTVWIPTVAGIAALVAGTVLLVSARRS